MPRHPTLPGALAFVCLAVACGSKPAPSAPPPSADAWAVVDGREIRRDDVEKAYRRATPATPVPSEEEALTAKLGVLDELIMQDILAERARALALQVTDAEVDTAFNERKKNLPDEAFQKELVQRGLTPADMRDGLRRELTVQKLIEREVGSKISVSEQEITAFYDANRAQFNLAETAYRIAQIVVTPVRDAQIANRRNDDATTPAAAAQKAQMLMDRLKAGASFADLAMDYSEDPQSAPQGGDLGFVPASSLNQVAPPLRDAVLKSTPGTVSTLTAGGAHTLVLLLAREAAGQRDLSVPAVRDGILSTLRGRKEQLLRTAYLTAARDDATVVNYLARRLLESQGKPPALLPSAPGKP